MKNSAFIFELQNWLLVTAYLYRNNNYSLVSSYMYNKVQNKLSKKKELALL